jgi:hypothetical protein
METALSAEVTRRGSDDWTGSASAFRKITKRDFGN